MMTDTRLKIDDTYNIRDLGGYPTVDGTITATHALIRAGNLDQLSFESQQKLIDYGVKTVIDLRDEWETEDYPNVFARSTVVQYHNLPLIGHDLANDEMWQKEERYYHTLDELYIKYLNHCQAQIRQIMMAIAESPRTIIFHCFAGKDRTGIIAGLLLRLADVPHQVIAEDYAKSYDEIQHLIQEWRDYAIQHGRDLDALDRDAASNPDTMLNMLHYIEREYGSIGQFLKACGLSDADLQQLKSHLIESDS